MSKMKERLHTLLMLHNSHVADKVRLGFDELNEEMTKDTENKILALIEDAQDTAIAIERLNNPGKRLTIEEMQEELGLSEIQTDEDYQAALKSLEALIDLNPQPDSLDGKVLKHLSAIIGAYEAKHYPIDEPTAKEAAKFRAGQEGWTAEPPSVEGWYWFDDTYPAIAPIIIRIDHRGMASSCSGMKNWPVRHLEGKFQGPLKPGGEV